MIKIRRAFKEDADVWNKIALESPEGTYSHTWEWQEIISDVFDYEPINLIAEVKNEPVAIYSAFKRKIDLKLLGFINNKINALYSPIVITNDYGGPAAIKCSTEAVYKEIMKAMELHARIKHIVTCKISTINPKKFKDIFSYLGYSAKPRYTWMIPLDIPEEAFIKGMKKSNRGVKKADKAGITVRRGKEEDMEDIYKCLKSVDERAKIGLPPKKFFEHLVKKFMPKDWVRFYISEKDGKVAGVNVVFTFKDMTLERYRGSYMEYRNDYSDNAIVFYTLTNLKKDGYKLFDFGGVPMDPYNGIYFFKSRWGGKLKEIPWFVKDINMAYSYMKPIGRILKK